MRYQLRLPACSTPQAGVELGRLTVKNVEALQGHVQIYKDTVNHNRESAATRLAVLETTTQHRLRRNEIELQAWAVADNKAGLSILKALRAQDDSFKTDPYTMTASRYAILKRYKDDYGKLDVKLDEFDDVIKNTNLAINEKSGVDRFEFVKGFLESVTAAVSENTNGTADVAGTAKALSSENNAALERATEALLVSTESEVTD